MTELLAVTTVGGANAGIRATAELNWPMSDFLPDDGGWYVKVVDYDWPQERRENEIRGARYAWHPQPGPPPLLPWLSVSRVREPWPPAAMSPAVAEPGKVRNWLTGLFYGTGGIMVRAHIKTVEIEQVINREPLLVVNGLHIRRGDFWDDGVIRIIRREPEDEYEG